MGRSSHMTRSLTRQAADRLLASGLTPNEITVDKVYEEIGTGSRTTINEELKAWRAQARAKVPSGVPDSLVPTIQTLWNQALDKAQVQYSAERETFTQERTALTEKAAWLTKQNEDLAREAGIQETALRDKSAEAENLRLQLAETRTAANLDRAVEKVRAEGLERSLAVALSDKETVAIESAQRLKAVQAEYARREGEQRDEYATREAQLRDEIRQASHQHETAIGQIRTEHAKALEATKQLEIQVAATSARSEELVRELGSERAKVNQLNEALAIAHAQTRTATDALHALEIKAAGLQATLQAREESLQIAEARRVTAEATAAESGKQTDRNNEG